MTYDEETFAELARQFVQGVIDTDATVDTVDAIEVAGVVNAILRGDKYCVDVDDKLYVWANNTFAGSELFARVFEVAEVSEVAAVATPARVNQEKMAAALHWSRIADDEEASAQWQENNGYPRGDVSSFYNRARTYRITAETLRREAVTGKPHCSWCGLDHPNHEHPSLLLRGRILQDGRDATVLKARCRCGETSCPWCFRNATSEQMRAAFSSVAPLSFTATRVASGRHRFSSSRRGYHNERQSDFTPPKSRNGREKS